MCIAVLVVVVVLGIYRIHVTHQQEVKQGETTKEADANWDESALTITVNPMENLQKNTTEEEEASEEEEEEDDEDEEVTSDESDDSEEDVDVQLPRMQRSSEKPQRWDKTTICY